MKEEFLTLDEAKRYLNEKDSISFAMEFAPRMGKFDQNPCSDDEIYMFSLHLKCLKLLGRARSLIVLWTTEEPNMSYLGEAFSGTAEDFMELADHCKSFFERKNRRQEDGSGHSHPE